MEWSTLFLEKSVFLLQEICQDDQNGLIIMTLTRMF